MDVSSALLPAGHPERGVFSNRTLNLRSIKAIGYDMDYTLLHYRVGEWEREAFESAREGLMSQGWPLEELSFDASNTIQGLVFDLQHGNLVKATRFGYVIQAYHGTRELAFEDVRSLYGATVVDLAEERFEFTNTLFSLSEESLYMQLVDLLDADALPGVMGYADLYRSLADALDSSHRDGSLKAKILADPDRFVEPDPEVVATLVDQREAGKRLVLITNSEWSYTQAMMSHVFDPQLGGDGTWRDLFDIVIVSAAKPRFFSARDAAFEVVDEQQSLLAPALGELEMGRVYFGGNAEMVERSLGLSGGQILYVGDHLFGDVHVLKAMLRWRTALILRELEAEVLDAIAFGPDQERLDGLMSAKADVERRIARLRLEAMQAARARAHASDGRQAIDAAKAELVALDDQIAPLAKAAGQLGNPIWGPLMRAGSDKSLFARQVERHADLYTSRVSNLGLVTPYAYLRASRGSLPHDAASGAVDRP